MTTDRLHPVPKPSPTDARSDLPGHPLGQAMAAALDGRELLTHPFYQRWQAGALAPGELSEYAVNYRIFEEALPVVLTAVVEQLRSRGEVEAAASVSRNLDDELGRPEPHLTLFDRFAAALEPAASTGPGAAAQALVGTYHDLADAGPVAALAGLAAYEVQAAAIATTKSQGLRQWYGMDASGTEFWDVHAGMETDHGDWALDALALLGADASQVAEGARRGADAWWEFLDEREADAAITV